MKRDKGRLPQFVPLLVSTLDSRAWRAMSHGARSLYVASCPEGPEHGLCLIP